MKTGAKRGLDFFAHAHMFEHEFCNIAGLCPRVSHLMAQVEQLMRSQSKSGTAKNIDVGALT